MTDQFEFTLSDNSSAPYAWILNNVDLTDIDDAKEFVETLVRGLINGLNHSEQSDDDVYEAWEEEEYEEVVEYVTEAIHSCYNAKLTIIDHEGIKYQDNYIPDCPICGMKPTIDELDGEITYTCGHYVDVYNPWVDGSTDSWRWEAARYASHSLLTHHELGGTNEWFFDAKSEQLNAVMTSTEIAEAYGIDDSTIRQAHKRHTIRARKSGNTLLILRADAEARWGKRKG